MKKMVQVVEEKVDLIKEESPWKEEIEQLSHKKINIDQLSQEMSILNNFFHFFLRFGQIDFQKLFLLLTGFRNIPEDK